jgi:hypothetical protein
MSNIDLSIPGDFALATGAGVNTILGAFGLSNSDWEIEEGSYNDVRFHVFRSKTPYNGALSEVVDRGGRRKAKYVFPYVDGQATEDMGRMANAYDLDVVIFGDRYLDGANKLLAELHKPEPGTLVHPVWGRLTVVMESYQITHSHEQRKAIALRLTLIEHTVDLDAVEKLASKSTFRSAIGALVDTFQTFSQLIAKIEAATMFVSGLKNLLKSLAPKYEESYTETVAALNAAFGKPGSTDLGGILPVGAASTAAKTYLAILSPNDPFAKAPLEQLSAATRTAIAASAAGTILNRSRTDAAMLSKALSAADIGAATLPPALNALLGLNPDGTEIDGGTVSESAVGSLQGPSATPQNTNPGALAEIPDGFGALYFHDDIVAIRAGLAAIQKAYDLGISTSRTKIVQYEIPRLMSLREAAWLNGVDVEKVGELSLLNPELESANYVPPGTVISIPKGA